jgi:uncharacterized repeat protein (TIGR03803 family)
MRNASLHRLLLFVFVVCLLASPALSQTETVLYTFTGGSDGGLPWGSLVMDRDGNLYGTTSEYGDGPCNFPYQGCGTVFELSPENGAWIFNVLYTFQGGEDGANPAGTLTLDAQGNLYGTTMFGGSLSSFGYGTVFELKRTGSRWTEEVLHRFAGGADGESPTDVVPDENGDLYGTTSFGGDMNCSTEDGAGCGVVFQLRPSRARTWIYKILHTFHGGNDGAEPDSGVTFGPKHVHVPFEPADGIYGVTKWGGASTLLGGGIVFHLVPVGNSWKYRILYSFGEWPAGGSAGPLIFDNKGNVYGVTENGGHCCGTIFELQPPNLQSRFWRESDLWPFHDPGFLSPVYKGGVVRDSSGNLYGTTDEGGTTADFGTAFRLTRTTNTWSIGTWNETAVYGFPGGAGGQSPRTGLILDGRGNAYGMTQGGGLANCSAFGQPGCGVVYEITGLAPSEQ